MGNTLIIVLFCNPPCMELQRFMSVLSQDGFVLIVIDQCVGYSATFTHIPASAPSAFFSVQSLPLSVLCTTLPSLPWIWDWLMWWLGEKLEDWSRKQLGFSLLLLPWLSTAVDHGYPSWSPTSSPASLGCGITIASPCPLGIRDALASCCCYSECLHVPCWFLSLLAPLLIKL